MIILSISWSLTSADISTGGIHTMSGYHSAFKSNMKHHGTVMSISPRITNWMFYTPHWLAVIA